MQVMSTIAKRFFQIIGLGALVLSSSPGFTQSNDRPAKIRTALKKAEAFLIQIQKPDGAIRDTINPLFETWETILAATALHKINTDTSAPPLKKAIRFLRNNENDDGLICHNQKCKKAYCLETTAAYFSLLMQMGEIEKVRVRIGQIVGMQKNTGQWEIGNPDVIEQKEFPSITAFVLNMMKDAGQKPTYAKEAIDWMLNNQTRNGNWGSAWEYYECPAYALWPVMKWLRGRKDSRSLIAFKKATEYIQQAQSKDGSWFYSDAGGKKTVSPQLQTALMLSALQNDRKSNKTMIEKGIDFLLAQQDPTGYWDGGDFPIPNQQYIKREYVFATSLCIMVLNDYLKNLPAVK